jgi:hypothetical protein
MSGLGSKSDGKKQHGDAGVLRPSNKKPKHKPNTI